MIWLLACAEAEPSAAGTCETGSSYVAVVSRLVFARAADGVSNGFDLDGVVTSSGGATGCGVADYVDPTGRTGIDNGFALLMPVIELTEAIAVEGLVQDAINSGELLLMFELSGVDDRVDDGCVSFEMARGEGVPMMGTDGTLEWSQTFDRDRSVEPTAADGLVLADGEVEAWGLEVELPLQILNAELLLHLHEGALRAALSEDGSFTGVFGGGVAVEEILAVASYKGIDEAVAAGIAALLDIASDLDPDGDGACERIAITFEFTAVPAFWFADSGA